MESVFSTTSEDPIEVFRLWMRAAEELELNDANAAALATANQDGYPSVRMVLIKQWDSNGFRFFTNAHSRKGREIEENPRAAICFHWKSLRRQVRVEGRISRLDDAVSDEYFHSRSRRSQIAAAVSHQSEPLADRATLEAAVKEFTLRHEESEVPRPAYWRGFVLNPVAIEFWEDGEARLHHRVVFRRVDQAWQRSLLYP